MENTKDFLLKLCKGVSVSGFEYNNQNVLIDSFGAYTDSLESDNLGSLIFKKNGTNKTKIMLAAHFDELGIVITNILDGGFLKFAPIGNTNPTALIAQEVLIKGKKDILGIIGIKHMDLMYDDKKNDAVKIDDLYIDTGFPKEELSQIVRLGDVAVIKRDVIKLKNDYISGRGLDNRSGVAVMFEAAKELNTLSHKSNIYFTATAQEEVGLRGARTSSYKINPDFAIVIDVGMGLSANMNSANIAELGHGPGIVMGSNTHPKLTQKMMEIAKKYDIDYQIKILIGRSGTDAAAIQVTREGIPCIIISIPLRYMHTSVETISFKDIENSGRLIAKFINELDNCSLEEVLCF